MEQKTEMENVMRTIKVAKLTLNVGAGKEKSKMEKGQKLIEHITGISPVSTKTNKRVPSWGLRPGLAIGYKLTLRGKKAEELLARLLKAKESKLSESQFDNEGNFSFGIHEYIDIPGVKYVPEIGIFGFEVAVTLERPGYRIKTRRLLSRRIPKNHRITKEDALDFVKSKYGVRLS